MANNGTSAQRRRRVGTTVNPHNRGAMNDLGNERPGDGGTRRTLPDPTTRDYKGSKSGVWTNANGTQVGQSNQEDSTIRPMKSTGDTAPSVVDQYVRQQNRKLLRSAR